jgi:lysophospholipase L1-like esterase
MPRPPQSDETSSALRGETIAVIAALAVATVALAILAIAARADAQEPSNQPPTADAGVDQTVASEATVTLDGTGSSDPDGDQLTYAWSQFSGGSFVILSGEDTPTATFTAPLGPDTLEFELFVCDDEFECSADTTVVTVLGPTIEDLIESVEALGLPSKLESSLLKKLTGAQQSVGADDLDAACRKLASFVDEVERQSGKGIDPADAGQLIAEAQAVMTSLGCEPPSGGGGGPSGGGPSGPLYVALGDSVTAGGLYVDLLFTHYQSTLGVKQLSNRAAPGENSGSIRTPGGQLDRALADINSKSDTRVVTIGIGGNDLLAGCDFTDDESCDFRENFTATLGDLQNALARDRGEEPLIALAYYNPDVGEVFPDGDEALRDDQLLGDSVLLNCADTGTEVGLNDVIAQEANVHGALLANAYPAFKIGGQDFMADAIHPNDAGHQAIAEAFIDAAQPCP